ncbi:MAG: TrkA family potassium uptake protein [Planctomycetota bacterium]
MKVILVGSGRTLYFLGQTFVAQGHSITIIDRDSDDCLKLARNLKATIVQGDASEPSILEEAGARGADIVLAATESDPDNLIICHMAQSRFGVPRAVALVNDPDNQNIFRKLGVDAISTSLTVASLIEQRAAFDQVMNVIPASEGRVMISEVALDERSPVVGLRLADVQLPEDALIAVLNRGSETLIPRGHTVLESGDRVLVVMLTRSREATLFKLTGQSS